MKIDNICKKVLVSEEEIQATVKKIGEQISKDYDGEEVTMIGLLNGCNPFFSDLLKHIDLLIEVDYMRASSYHGSIKSSNEVLILKDLDKSIKGKNVIVVDDIIDTGETLKCIIELLKLKGAKTIEACVLLDKDIKRNVAYKPKYIGLKIPKEFVVGYGLDYNEHYRNLPYIGAVKDEVYTKEENNNE